LRVGFRRGYLSGLGAFALVTRRPAAPRCGYPF
jgi:hypothetical protein